MLELEGFPTSWTEHIIVLIFKSEDPMMPNNYMTIISGYYVAKLYSFILDSELSNGQRNGFSWTGRLLEGVYNFGSHINPLSPYWRSQNPWLEDLLMLCGFLKSLWHCTTHSANAAARSPWCPYGYALGTPSTVWIRVRKVWSPNGLLEAVFSAIGLKQGFPQSTVLFSLYRDEMSHYIERFGSSGACLTGIVIQIILYDDDILLSSNTPEVLRRHLNLLKVFCMDKGFSVNIDKTKVRVFNTPLKRGYQN